MSRHGGLFLGCKPLCSGGSLTWQKRSQDVRASNTETRNVIVAVSHALLFPHWDPASQAFFWFLKPVKLLPASGPLHLLFSLLEMIVPLIFHSWILLAIEVLAPMAPPLVSPP